jgi:hypothetical protein
MSWRLRLPHKVVHDEKTLSPREWANGAIHYFPT